MGLTMKQRAYIKGNKNFLGTITLESGERFNFVSGQRFLYLMFPFLQWVMPVYCWKESDDVNQDIDFNKPLVIFLICMIPLNRNRGVGFPLSFYIPPVLSIGAALIIGIVFLEYLERKFRVPQNVTLYKVQIYPRKWWELLILLANILISAPEFVALWAMLAMPCDFWGPYMLLVYTPVLASMNNVTALSLRKCSVEFLEEIDS